MISVVCVYNNQVVLEQRLLSSLERQNACYDVVPIDNRDGAFTSATKALNHGSERAIGEWIMFVHQDVALLSPEWLTQAESILEREAPTGWVGIAGRDMRGKTRGFMLDRAALYGQHFGELAEVQTLDECLLIHRRRPRGVKYFDEGVPGWHAYGVDACCDAIREGEKNYVIPLLAWHDSASINMKGLEEAHRYVWNKHGAVFRQIHTTCGTLPELYGWQNGEPSIRDRVRYRAHVWGKRFYGLGQIENGCYAESLEMLTEDEHVVECLHQQAPNGEIVTAAFVPQPIRSRVIRHRFSGLNTDGLESDCVVVAPDLAHIVPKETERLGEMTQSHRRIIICVYLSEVWGRPAAWRKVLRQAVEKYLTTNRDGTSIVVFQLGKKKTMAENA